IAAFEPDRACIRLDQPQHQAADGGFAAAGFADQRQRPAGIKREGNAIDGFDMRQRPAEQRTLGDEMLDQAIDLEQRHHDTSRSSGARRQRERWSGLTSTNGGGPLVQASSTNGQRAAKRQPAGGCAMFGTMPSIVASWSARWSSRGIEPSRPTV